MTFEAELAELMGQKASVKHALVPNAYGKSTLGPTVEFRCRCVFEPKMIRTVDGREIVSAGHLWTVGEVGIKVTDEITLPDGTKPKILRVDSIPDESADTHHERVWF